MLYATEQLRARLRLSNLGLFEPSGQDGRVCQYLAIIDQLKLNGAHAEPRTSDAYELESDMIEWLDAHAADVTGVNAVRGDEAELTLLRDCWTDLDFLALRRRTAWGDHCSLSSVLSMLGERGICAQAYVYDFCGEEYDSLIHAPEIYGVVPTMTLKLAFVGSRGCM